MHLIWAYQGAPTAAHHAFPESSAMIAWRIDRGSVRIDCRESPSVEAAAGNWLMPAADKVRHEFSDDAVITSVRFKAHWPDNTPLLDAGRSIVLAVADVPRLKSATRILLRATAGVTPERHGSTTMLLDQMGFASYTRLNQATFRWMSAYYEAMTQHGAQVSATDAVDLRVNEVRQTIDDMPMGQRMDEASLARSVALSVSQLNRLFVFSLGVTPRAYAENRRLNFARETLLASTTPAIEIAFLLGFTHASHFSAWFKKKLQIYPSQFRRLNNTYTTQVLG